MITKPSYVREMFGSIARRYDLANHVLSCGIDFYWRAHAANIVAGWRPYHIADLATGTGDLALALQKRLPDADITGVDFLPEMLELARQKRSATGTIGGRDETPISRCFIRLHHYRVRL